MMMIIKKNRESEKEKRGREKKSLAFQVSYEKIIYLYTNFEIVLLTFGGLINLNFVPFLFVRLEFIPVHGYLFFNIDLFF